MYTVYILRILHLRLYPPSAQRQFSYHLTLYNHPGRLEVSELASRNTPLPALAASQGNCEHFTLPHNNRPGVATLFCSMQQTRVTMSQDYVSEIKSSHNL